MLPVLFLISAVCFGRKAGSKRSDSLLDKREYFAEHHAEMMSELSDNLVGPLDQLLASDQGPIFRTENPRVKWTPVQCKLLNIELNKVDRIYKGKRNHVFLMEDNKTGVQYAMKVFDLPEEYTPELNLAMITAGHPYMVQPICIKTINSKPAIVFEYVSGLKSSDYACKPSTTYSDIQRMSAQLMEALTYIHFQGFIHADMKPNNVMMTPRGDIKVIDFGFALKLPYTKGNRGTPSTMAPELVNGVDGPIHEGVDWWAYASTLAMWNSLHFARHRDGRFVPLVVERSADRYSKMFQFGTCPAEFDEDLRAFLYIFLRADPDKRKFNTQAQIAFLKRTPYLASKFPQRAMTNAVLSVATA